MAEWILLAAGSNPIIPGDYIVGGIVVWAIVQVLSTVIVAKVLGVKLSALIGRVERLEDRTDRFGDGLNQAREERSECEHRADRTYPTRAELMRIAVDQVAQGREVSSKLDSMQKSMRESVARVHARVDDAVKELSEIKGQLKGRRDGPVSAA